MALDIGGKVTFSIIGAYCEEFINELFSLRIGLKNIRSEKNVIYADTGKNNYPRIAKMSRKYGVRVRIEKKSGSYRRLYALRKRPGLAAGVLISAVMVLTLRLFVWHIDVHGNNGLSDDYILNVLEQYGFTAGVLANDTDALEAERRIMMSSDKINWINIEVNGSRADVYLSEEEQKDKEDVDFKTPCNIVAGRSGVISETNVTSGKLLYKEGSGVAEGSVIVSGAVNSGDTLVLVHSDASVIAEFSEDLEFSMDYTTTERIPSSESKIHRQLMLLGIVIPMDGDIVDKANMICTEQTEQLSMFGFPVPARIKTETYSEYKDISVTRKTDDIKRILESRLELYINNFFRDYEVLDTEKSYDITDGGITLRAKVKLKGDIGVKQPIYEH